MAIDPKLYKQLVDIFSVELDEQLQVITDGLLALEKKTTKENCESYLNTIFRAAHNIKGSANGIDIENVGDIAHHLEDLFSKLRQKKLTPSPEVTDVCLESLDYIRGAMQFFLEGKLAKDFNKTTIIEKLAKINLSEKIKKAKHKKEPPKIKKSEKASESRIKAKKQTSLTAKGKRALSKPAVSIEKPQKTLEISGAVEFIKVNANKIAEINSLSDELQNTKLEIDDIFKYMQKLRSNSDIIKKLWQSLSSLLKKQPNYLEFPEEVQSTCDNGLDLSTEMQQSIIQMYQRLRASNNQLSLTSHALQENVRILRLVPTATILQPLLRTTRDISRELSKNVNITITGDEIEVDRVVLDLAKNPLQHLLRNAIDHGIETPGERKKLGKSEIGQISITVSREGEHILIAVQDDGRGMDIDAIARSATKRNLISAEELAYYTRDQILDLSFNPGISTKNIVTNLSGRGVGLDVVRTNMQKVKGDAKIVTEPGKGTTITLYLPLTLATERGMLVKAGDNVFAIPTTSLKHILDVKFHEIQSVESGQVILLGNRPIPLRDLVMTLELSAQEKIAQDCIPVVIVEKGPLIVAFIVDKIIGEREIVIKHLMAPLLSIRNVSGATLTGRGEVIIVLNPIDLVTSALQSSAQTRLSTIENKGAQKIKPYILVVEDSITTRTLETNILSSQGYEVKSAINGKEAWRMLQTESFDLIVTDIVMPEMDGFELTKLIKEDEKLKGIPVVIVTTKAEDADKQRGIEVGADAYIVKSQFESKALIEVVNQLL